ncbi:MAG: primosomal protein N', partial [Planctomycetota bacterium]
HIADSTYCSWGQALFTMLPAALRRGRLRRTIPVAALARQPDPEELSALAERHPKQERALAFLMAAGGRAEVRELLGRTGLSRSPLDSLRRRGLVRMERRNEYRDPFAGVPPAERTMPHRATPRQEACIAEIIQALEGRAHADFLLFGVTGSGKTEVYLRSLERCLSQKRGAIVLVPEIALTPQAVARFQARVGRVAVLHSGLTDAERHDQWQAIQDGRLRVVIGARSALFAPMPDLGLIVVDEEHETSFKQEQTPRYHARDVARERARLEKAVCVLGSATPSLESWQSVREGSLRLLELPDRVAGGRLPQIEVVDLRTEKPPKGHWLIVSEPLRRALEQALSRGERAILFLNRRGFAPAWHCRTCGGSVTCRRCDVAVTYHRGRNRALCHVCLEETVPPEICPACGAPLSLVGVGTERAEAALAKLFPQARIARMDRDTMLRREMYEQILGDFGSGKLDILLGTQMVAKGLDFPDVTVVGVLNADTALHHPDFRAAERCFNLISQVSGRAGRSHRGGKVVVQTWLPEHPAIQAAVRHDYRGFARRELEERDTFHFPPAARGVRVVLESPDRTKVEGMAREAIRKLQAAAAPGCMLLGPAPPPVERLKGRLRRQILVKAVPPRAMDALREVFYDLCQRPGIVVDPL